MTADPADTTGGDPLAAALHYASLGWRVVPIKPGMKRPPMESWQHAATTDEKVIRNWFRGLYRGHGVGIATGEASGIFVLDVDVSDGKAGDETLADLEAEHGPLPDTVRAITGTGGRHIIFLLPPGRTIRNNASTRLGPGLDIRGNGGQIVAAPTVHPNGRPYCWEIDHAPGDIAVAMAPDWLLDLLDPPAPAAPPPAPTRLGTILNSDSIMERINADHDWHQLLYADGWSRHSVDARNGDTHWTRPGKDVRDGASAVLHEPDGPLVVFSTDASLAALHRPELAMRTGDGFSMSKFAYLAATRHNGDQSACASAYRTALNASQTLAVTAQGGQVAYAALTGAEAPVDGLLIDWQTFWARDHSASEWLIDPVLAEGRSHSIYAPAGTGKSLLALWLAVRIATGKQALDTTPAAPRHVLYLDYEMTESDLYERLDAMGYGPDTDLSRLHYALLPMLPPLDTAEGGRTLEALAARVGADVVVVDTFGRAVEGDENDADTTRGFFRHTGMVLKASGRTVLRTDHAGKDPTKGQRGSSAKNDDVDVVWSMTVVEGGYSLTAKKRRAGWIPEQVNLTKMDDPELGFRITGLPAIPAGTRETIQLLDSLDVPVDVTSRRAAEMVKDAGHKVRRTILLAALKARRQALTPVDNPVQMRPKVVPDRREPLGNQGGGNHLGNHSDQICISPGQDAGNHSGTTGNHLHADWFPVSVPLGTEPEPLVVPESAEIDNDPWAF